MGERADATWSAKRVGVSVPRQNGKSQLLVARALAGALLFGEKKIVISAHQADTARETFSKMVEILEADGNEWLFARLKPYGIMNAINREKVSFRNGATIQFKARTGAGGRGFSSDCLMLDEAQRLKRPAWVSINSTMSAMQNPQVWLLGTPPTREDVEAQMGEVFASVRESAMSGASTASAWCEWGLDPESEQFASVMRPRPASWSADDEWACWASNPAWNTRINLDVVQGEFESYSAEEFAQDRCGVWLDDLGGKGSRRISAEAWDSTAVEEPPSGRKGFAVAFSLDGSKVALAGVRATGEGAHVQLMDVGAVESAGVGPLADWLAVRWRECAFGIVISGRAGADALQQALYDRGVARRKVRVASTGEYFAACSMFDDAVSESVTAVAEGKPPVVTHWASEGQWRLDESVASCDRKQRGQSGAWGWFSTVPGGDETPLEAVSLAYWASRTGSKSSGGAVFV